MSYIISPPVSITVIFIIICLLRTLVHELGHVLMTKITCLFIKIPKELRYSSIVYCFPSAGRTHSGIYKFFSEKSPNYTKRELFFLKLNILSGILFEVLYLIICSGILYINTSEHYYDIITIYLFSNIFFICKNNIKSSDSIAYSKLCISNKEFYYSEKYSIPTKEEKLKRFSLCLIPNVIAVITILLVSIFFN